MKMPKDFDSFEDFEEYRNEIDTRMNFDKTKEEQLIAELRHTDAAASRQPADTAEELRNQPYMPAPAVTGSRRRRSFWSARQLAAFAAAIVLVAALLVFAQQHFLPHALPDTSRISCIGTETSRTETSRTDVKTSAAVSSMTTAPQPRIINQVDAKWKTLYSDVTIANEWVSAHDGTILFGALKSDPQQGVAIVTDPDYTRYEFLTPSRHGAIKAQKLLGSLTAVQVSAEDGRQWIFNLPQGFADKPDGGIYAGEWEQIARLRYVEGTVVSLQKNTDGTAVLKLKIITNYHSGTDPLNSPDDPFKIGGTEEFILQKLPKTALTVGEDIVLYEADVYPLSGSMDQFKGALVRYYKQNGKYVDLNGKAAAMPPEDYPEFGKLFNLPD